MLLEDDEATQPAEAPETPASEAPAEDEAEEA
jgi:hypothetical protein